MAKPLHAGRAAQAGLLSALLAAGGFSANPAVLEASQGFAETHGSQLTAAEPARAEAPFAILGTLFKYHAACYLTHATIEGVRALEARAEDVERIQLRVDATCRGVCDIEQPKTGMEAKFSLKATAAMALLRDATSDPRAFSDARARSPELTAWLPRVSVEFAPMPATRSEVALQLRDGRVLKTACDTGLPERDLARQTARLREKFLALAPLPARQAEALADGVLALEQLPDVRALHALCHCR
jgi:2-methylcitrate dehydratase PrpD